jgi:hypothetical protein
VTDFDALKAEIQRERERLNELERRVNGMETVSNRLLRFIQGDAELLEKGAAARMLDFGTFISEMKGFDFKKMSEFASEYDEFKKRFLWLTGGIFGLSGILAGILTNLDRIQKLFHH